MRRLNNKGYMLVEIILASVIAFGIAYFMIDLTIKLKNKNDDTIVETQVVTDQDIITNKLMDYAISEGENFDCSELTISGNQIKYKNNVVDILDEYIKNPQKKVCKNELGVVEIEIALDVPQIPEKDFNVNVTYKYEIGDLIPPEIAVTVDEGTTWKKSHKGTIKISDNSQLKPGSYTIKYAWGTSAIACSSMSSSVTITVGNGENEKTSEVTISSGTGDGKLYICNSTEIVDFAENTLAANTTKNATMKLDNSNPSCKLTADSSNVKFNTKSDDSSGSGIDTYGIIKGSTETYDNNTTVSISTGTFSGYVKDKVGNKASCSLVVKATTPVYKYKCTGSVPCCPSGYSSYSSTQCRKKTGTNCYCKCHGYGDINLGSQSNCSSACLGYCGGSDYSSSYTENTYSYKSYTSCTDVKTNQSTCPSGYTSEVSSTTYTCDSDYTKINDNYCYK